MSQPKSSSVHRYFPLADSFLEIRQFGADANSLDARTDLDLSGYKRLIVGTCMPQFAADLAEQISFLFPEDPQVAEDLLYDLCIEVNPGLDVHRVSLRSAVERSDSGTEFAQRTSPNNTDSVQHLANVSRDLERRLRRKVHGQDAAIHAVCRAVQRFAAGLTADNRPLGSFLLVGRTGTGKTELCRQLARELTPSSGDPNRNLLRIDCSEYALAHDYSKLLGSPPGYVGHEDGGVFTRALRETPGAVILFDEIEKAHPRMHNLMLQVLEEGCLTDGRGQRVDLAQNMVLMTSNAGAEDIQKASRSVGYHSPGSLSDETLMNITDRALGQLFSPEFLGRLDQVILFSELQMASAVCIARDQLMALSLRARQRGARVAFTGAVARWVAKKGYSPEFGARELRSVIQKHVEPELAQLLLRETLSVDDLVRGRIQGGALHLSIER